ncbi:MAG: hypothetical protein AW07_00894 [Candidatus Accumulibacter sp. SK-11]|nr:MAG: hypothetical protein AW07_00894 [Candidatus Accumulibacter sp. SK-11]
MLGERVAQREYMVAEEARGQARVSQPMQHQDVQAVHPASIDELLVPQLQAQQCPQIPAMGAL